MDVQAPKKDSTTTSAGPDVGRAYRSEAGLHKARRERLLEVMGPGVAIIAAAPVALRNNDVEHDYRQESDLYYLTGFEEPESVLIVSNLHPEHRAVLFLRAKDPQRERWDGRRVGVEGAVSELGMDAAHPIETLEHELGHYLANGSKLHYRLGRNPTVDAIVISTLSRLRARARAGQQPPNEIVDPTATLHEMRMRKDAREIALMRRAGEITRNAFYRAMEIARPGVYEFEVEAELLRTFRAHGAARPAYGPIVGSAENATVLHYRANDRRMTDGDLLLIDAGCEYGYYASDVTRTFPINGRHTDPQRALCQAVFDAQQAAIGAVGPGATLADIHEQAVRSLSASLIRLGLLTGNLDEVVRKEEYKTFFMHRTSHWLGMDVHDVGAYLTASGDPRPLEPGMVLTVEPGLYVPPDTEGVESHWLGMGIRIEDDVLVTDTGSETLTADIPASPTAIEAFLAEHRG